MRVEDIVNAPRTCCFCGQELTDYPIGANNADPVAPLRQRMLRRLQLRDRDTRPAGAVMPVGATTAGYTRNDNGPRESQRWRAGRGPYQPNRISEQKGTAIMSHDDPYPVDSATRTCCGGIGRHTADCTPDVAPAGRREECASWCTDADRHVSDQLGADVSCWGRSHSVFLHLEEGGPSPYLSDQEKSGNGDFPRIDPMAYRGWHDLPVVFLHLYRPSDNKFRDLDAAVKLTVEESVELAGALRAVVEEITGETVVIR